ncbi:hypothetical protein J3R82DRAFT_9269 [Butyriboletus roseoflavus]|nr:hypothetical protein J3R82DRAFT_9269 [Butyriboletus roseoflavus]
MHNLVIPAPPPTMESFAPEFCFCGRKTVESHEFWFCSSQCARLDSLRSLDDPESHYRKVVRTAYVRAGVPELYPHRMVSIDQLHPGPSEQRGFANAPSHVLPPMKSSHQRNISLVRRNAHHPNTGEFPTLSQVTGKLLNKKAAAGEALVAQRYDRPRFQGFPNALSRARPVQSSQDHTFEQISLDAIPFQEHVSARSLRHVPQSSDGFKNNLRRSVTALLNVGRSRKVKEGENPERVFGHPVNTFVPMVPVRKESLPSHRQRSPPSAIPGQKSKALRRSASFAGWYTTPYSGPPKEQDAVMRVIKEMREECSESFDPRFFFKQEEDC